jgi:hypothetical protein
MDLSMTQMPCCEVVKAFIDYLNYDRYNTLKATLGISSGAKIEYVKDTIEIFDLNNDILDECKIVVVDFDSILNIPSKFVLVGIPDILFEDMDDNIFKYISKPKHKYGEGIFGNKFARENVVIKFIPNEFCDCNSPNFDVLKYLEAVYNSLEYCFDYDGEFYLQFPSKAELVYTIIHFMQLFNTADNRLIIKNILSFDHIIKTCWNDNEIEIVTDKVIESMSNNLDTTMINYNSAYRIVRECSFIINRCWDDLDE